MKKFNNKYFGRLFALTLTIVMLFSAFSPVFAAADEIIGDPIQGTLCDDLPTNQTFVLKNVGTGQYLTFGAENTNMYLSGYEYDYQSIQLVQEGSQYKLKHNVSDYAAFIIDIEGQLVYHIWTIGTSNHNGANWLFYKTGTDENGNSVFRIARTYNNDRSDNIDYVMTAYQFGSTGPMYATICPNNNSNTYQEWILEGYYPVIDVSYYSMEISVNLNEKIRLASYYFTSFETDDGNIATVDNNNILTANNLGKTTLTAINSSGNEFDVDLYVKLPDGKYYISDAQNNMMLSYHTVNNNIQCRLFSITGANEQKWELSYYSEGHYKISYFNGSSTYYLTATNDYDISLSSLMTSESGYTSTAQLWSFNTSDNGNIIIKPMCYDNFYLFSDPAQPLPNDSYGYYAGLCSYTNNSDLSDEWNIFQKSDVIILTNNTFGTERNYLYEYNIPGISCTNDFSTLEKEQMKSLLKSTETIIIYSHGNSNSIQISSDNYLTTADIEDEDLSNLKLAVLVCCSCGENGDNPNFLETLIDCGVETVIGFDIQINEINGAVFAKYFIQKYFLLNQPIFNAASSNITEIKEHIVIAGNTNLKYE